MSESELCSLEREGWKALSSSGDTAAEFYDRILDDPVTMLLPGGMVLDRREAAIASMSGRPWSDFELDNLHARELTADVGVVTYGVIARRDSASEYSALISSTYVRRGGEWRLTLHQQTPR